MSTSTHAQCLELCSHKYDLHVLGSGSDGITGDGDVIGDGG